MRQQMIDREFPVAGDVVVRRKNGSLFVGNVVVENYPIGIAVRKVKKGEAVEVEILTETIFVVR